jgi:hypothetical protein
MKTYQGTRDHLGTQVHVVTHRPGSKTMRSLQPRLDLWNHSPTGFEWGYGGSGPAQLALAILAHHFAGEEGGDQKAVDLHQRFKWDIVARFPKEGFVLNEEAVAGWVAIQATATKV